MPVVTTSRPRRSPGPVAAGFVDKRSKTILTTSRPDLLCNFCLTREKNAGIVHGRITHQICCYQCAKKLVKQRKPCPVCRCVS